MARSNRYGNQQVVPNAPKPKTSRKPPEPPPTRERGV